MYKKIIILACLFLFTGCSAYSLNNLSNEDIIKLDKLGVKAVVFGKAYYEHKIDIKTLMQYV